MRVLVLVKATEESERGAKCSTDVVEKMAKFNERLVDAGVMMACDGLHPSSKGKRVSFCGDKNRVTDGPFAETKELLAGFWIWNVQSIDDAVEWLQQAPFGSGTETEIRPILEAEDFGCHYGTKLGERDQPLVEQLAVHG